MLQNQAEIDRVVWANYRRFFWPEYMFGIDNNQNPSSRFDTASLRVLVVFASPGLVRSISNTFNALYSMAKEACGDEVFMDYAYFPEQLDLPLVHRLELPVWFGNVSHRPLTDYDVVFISHAVLPEVYNIPYGLYHSGIPLTFEARMARKEIPLIIYGGASSGTTGQILMGRIPADSEYGIEAGKSLVDLAFFGIGEGIVGHLLQDLVSFQKQGSVKGYKRECLRFLTEESQEKAYLYDPQAYEFHHGEDNVSISHIEKVNPKAPDRVKWGKKYMRDFLGFPIKVFSLDGQNANISDLLISLGCSTYMCSFCLPGDALISTGVGLKRMDALAEGEPVETFSGVGGVSAIYQTGIQPVVRVETKRGYRLTGTSEHPIMVFDGDGFAWKTIGELLPGDFAVLKRGYGFSGEADVSVEEAEFIGQMVGNGTWNTKFTLFSRTDRQEVVQGLLDRCSIAYTMIPKQRNTVEFYLKNRIQLRKRFEFPEYVEGVKQFPDSVLRWGSEQVCAFLRGYFDSDGTIGRNGDLSLSCVHRGFLEKVQLLLLGLGMVSTLSEDTRIRPSNEALGFKEEEMTLYRLHLVDASSYRVFLEKIGSSIPSRMESLRRAQRKISSLTVPLSADRRQEIVSQLGSSVSYIRYSLKGKQRGCTYDVIGRLPDGVNALWDALKTENYLFEEVVSLTGQGEIPVFDITVPQKHSFIANGFVVHNCVEGQTGGAWREKSLEGLIADMRNQKALSASNTLAFFSYNLNYYSKFMDLMKEAAHEYSNLSLITMRTDVIGTAPEYMELAKHLGLMRVSMAIEGIGDRVRNQILNKNLSREHIMQAAEVVFKNRFVQMKLVMIVTGEETQEDYEDWMSELQEILAIRDRIGANTQVTINHTPLVIYDQTPLRWMPRTTAGWALRGEKIDYLTAYIQECARLNIKVKFHGRGPGTYLEQAVLDMAQAGTGVLVEASIKRGLLFYRHFEEKHRGMMLESMKSHGIMPEAILRERDVNEPMPSDTMEFVHPFQVNEWRKQHKEKMFYHDYCLKTTAHLKPLAGCSTCRVCETKEEIQSQVARTIENAHTVGSVLESLVENRHLSSTRVIFRLGPKWDFFSKNALSHIITSRFLQASPKLLEAFHAVGKTTVNWSSKYGQKAWFSGRFAFDIYWKAYIPVEEVTSQIEAVNASLSTAQVEKAFEVLREDKLESVMGRVAYFGQIQEVDSLQMQERMARFDYRVATGIKSLGDGLMTQKQHHPELEGNLLFEFSSDKLLSVMLLPMALNPYLVLSSLMRWSYAGALEKSRFQVYGHYRKGGLPCSGCGKPTVFSILDNRELSVCGICAGKQLLYKAKMKGVSGW